MTVQLAFLFLVLGTKWGNESRMLMKSRSTSRLLGMFGSAGIQIHVWFCMEALGPHHCQHFIHLDLFLWPSPVNTKISSFFIRITKYGSYTTLCRTAMRSHHTRMKCIWNAWMIRLPFYMGGIISHDEHPPSRQQPFLRLWQQLLCHFWPWLQTPKWCWVSRRGGRRSYRGVGPTIITLWKWENRASQNWQVNQVLWWCRISPFVFGLFQVIMANLVPGFILGMFCKNWFWMASNWKLFLFRAPCRQDAPC